MVVEKVEADKLTGEGGWVGVVVGSDVSGVGDQEINVVGCLLQTHICPGEVRKQDQGVVGGVLK